jgi:hypothetical protein
MKSEAELERAMHSLKNLQVGMTEASRRHLALKCQEAGSSPWGALALRMGGPRLLRVPVAAGAMVLLLTLGVAFLTARRQDATDVTGYGGKSPVRLVTVVPASSGGVTLQWQDGVRRTYTVRKSTDPRNFRGAETFTVKGTRWTDPSPSAGQVVYYRVD